MNIAELQKRIEKPSITREQLIQYIQNPTSGPPGVSILALAELERRKRLPTPAQSNPMQPSVAAQKVAEARPQAPQTQEPMLMAAAGGITSLAGGGIVGSEEAYAAGGIIAFEDGGDVQGYASKGEVEEDWYRRSKKVVTPDGRIMYIPQGEEMPSYVPYEGGLKNILSGTAATKKLQAESGVGPLAASPKAAQGMPGMPTPVVVDPAYIESLQGTPDLYKGIVENKFKAPAAPAAPVPTSGFDVTPLAYNDAMYGDLARKEVTAEEGAQRFKTALGEDPTRAKLKERMGAMEKENEAFKAQYPWMALAEAGFGMASGTSQNALTNIAAGGMKGVEALGKGREKARAAEEKAFDLQARVADAERAENRAALQYGFDSEERVKASNDKIKLEKIAEKARIDVANKNIAVQKAQYGQKEREMLMDDARKGQQLAVSREVGMASKSEIKDIMKALRADPNNKGRSDAELLKMAYETKAAGSIYGANQRTAASERAAYVDEIESIGKQYPFGANMPPEVKQRLAQLRGLVSGGASAGAAAPTLTYNKETRRLE